MAERISLVEQYSNKDVIQQIYTLKQETIRLQEEHDRDVADVADKAGRALQGIVQSYGADGKLVTGQVKLDGTRVDVSTSIPTVKTAELVSVGEHGFRLELGMRDGSTISTGDMVISVGDLEDVHIISARLAYDEGTMYVEMSLSDGSMFRSNEIHLPVDEWKDRWEVHTLGELVTATMEQGWYGTWDDGSPKSASWQAGSRDLSWEPSFDRADMEFADLYLPGLTNRDLVVFGIRGQYTNSMEGNYVVPMSYNDRLRLITARGQGWGNLSDTDMEHLVYVLKDAAPEWIADKGTEYENDIGANIYSWQRGITAMLEPPVTAAAVDYADPWDFQPGRRLVTASYVDRYTRVPHHWAVGRQTTPAGRTITLGNYVVNETENSGTYPTVRVYCTDITQSQFTSSPDVVFMAMNQDTIDLFRSNGLVISSWSFWNWSEGGVDSNVFAFQLRRPDYLPVDTAFLSSGSWGLIILNLGWRYWEGYTHAYFKVDPESENYQAYVNRGEIQQGDTLSSFAQYWLLGNMNIPVLPYPGLTGTGTEEDPLVL